MSVTDESGNTPKKPLLAACLAESDDEKHGLA